MATTVDLGPAIINIVGVRAGDKNEMVINLKKDGVPYDVTGMTITAQARAKATDTGIAPIVAVVSIIDADAGKIDVRWPGDQVAEVIPSGKSMWRGVWDLQQVTGSEDPVTLIAGTFEVSMDVTR